METTLRKATRLTSQLDGKIAELHSTLQQATPKSVFIHDASPDIARRINGARDEYVAGLDLALQLTDARIALRTTIGSVNETSGVNALVTKLKGFESKLSLIRALIAKIGEEPRLSDREIDNRLIALREKSKNVTTRNYGNSNDDEVSLATLAQEDLDVLETLEKELTKKAEAAHDQLERVNNSVVVILTDDVVAALTAADVL